MCLRRRVFVTSKKLLGLYSSTDLFLNAGLLLNIKWFFFIFFGSKPYITLLSWKKLCVIPGATHPHFPCRFFWSLNPAIKWSHERLFDTWMVQWMYCSSKHWSIVAVTSPEFGRARLVLEGKLLRSRWDPRAGGWSLFKIIFLKSIIL